MGEDGKLDSRAFLKLYDLHYFNVYFYSLKGLPLRKGNEGGRRGARGGGAVLGTGPVFIFIFEHIKWPLRAIRTQIINFLVEKRRTGRRARAARQRVLMEVVNKIL